MMIQFTLQPLYTDVLMLEYLSKSFDIENINKVQVEREVTREGKTFMEKYWVNPDEMEKDDIIIGGYQNLPKNHQLHPSHRNYKEFQTAGASNLYFGNNAKITLKSFGKWVTSLNDSTKTFLFKYTYGFDKLINNYLRGIRNASNLDAKGLKQFHGVIKTIEHAIDNFELKDDMIVHRKVSMSLMKQFQVNDIWQDEGFCSTSTVNGSYSGHIDGDVCDITIKVPKGKGRGAWMAPISKFPNENEFLLNRGTLFKILSIKGNHVEMEIVGREPKDLDNINKSMKDEQSYNKFLWNDGELIKHKG